MVNETEKLAVEKLHLFFFFWGKINNRTTSSINGKHDLRTLLGCEN